MYAASWRYLLHSLAGLSVDRDGICVTPRRIPGLSNIRCSLRDIDGTEVTLEVENRDSETVVRIYATGEYRLVLNGREQRLRSEHTFHINPRATGTASHHFQISEE